VDNVVRCMPLLIQEVENLKGKETELLEIIESFDNKQNLGQMIELIGNYLHDLAEKGIYIPEAAMVFAEMKEDT